MKGDLSGEGRSMRLKRARGQRSPQGEDGVSALPLVCLRFAYPKHAPSLA